jgi:hypothetical protein
MLSLPLFRLTSLRVCACAAPLPFVFGEHMCSLGGRLRIFRRYQRDFTQEPINARDAAHSHVTVSVRSFSTPVATLFLPHFRLT